MAGAYPDVPSNRMAYDRDGTQVYWIDNSNNVSQLTSTQIGNLNDEDGDSAGLSAGGNQTARLFFFFPELRDLSAYFFRTDNSFGPASVDVEVSANTTNGLDGTWTTISTYGNGDVRKPASPIQPDYRQSIVTNARFGIRGVRFSGHTSGVSDFAPTAAHLYGNIAAGQNPKRLAIWHPTLDQHITGAYFDWGNTPRGSSADRTFRVKNLSPALTANDINLSMDAMTDTTPSVPGQFLISSDGTTFTGTIGIGNIAPSGLSSVLTVRRNTPSNATLSVWAARLLAQATSWS